MNFYFYLNMLSNSGNEDLLMVFPALLETVLMENHICMAFCFLISTFITLGICMEMWLASPQKFSFCCFLLFLLDLDSFVCSFTMTFTATNSILPETAFWQGAKGRSRRSRGGLKVQRSYFHESALCSGKMKTQKCCSVLFFSPAMIHATYLQLLYHFSFEMLQSLSIHLLFCCRKGL